MPGPTWAMMLAGCGMVGFGLRRRFTVTTTVRYAWSSVPKGAGKPPVAKAAAFLLG